jgi:hypothetical protein
MNKTVLLTIWIDNNSKAYIERIKHVKMRLQTLKISKVKGRSNKSSNNKNE